MRGVPRARFNFSFVQSLSQLQRIAQKLFLPDHNLLHNTSKKGKVGCQNDQIQVNLCPTYDICLDSLLYTVYAYYGLLFCVISILLSSIRVSPRAF